MIRAGAVSVNLRHKAIAVGSVAATSSDTTAPGTVTDLDALADGTYVTLSFTCPGDNGTSGGVPPYVELRYFIAPITNTASWNGATIITGPWASTAGLGFVVGSGGALYWNAPFGEADYYFNIRFKDAAGNISDFSNSPMASTSV